jgi:hypothetical protein
VGMTSRVCQGRCYLPAGVPGISAVLRQEDRLCPRSASCASSRLATPPRRARAGEDDKTPPTAASPKEAWPRQDRQRRGTGMTQATSRLHQPASRSLPHERIRGKRESICLPDAGPRGERHFIKLQSSGQGSDARGSRRGRSDGGAGSRTTDHLTCNQTPTYISGSGPLE